MLEFLRARLAELLEKRADLKADLDKVLEVPSREKRDLSADEATKFTEARAAITKLDDDEIKPLTERIAELEDTEKREQAANQLRAKHGQTKPDAPEKRTSVTVVAEPTVYGDGSGHSYFLDLARVDLNRGDGDGGPTEARERLKRHAAELDVEMPAREKRRRERAEQQMRGAFGDKALENRSPFEKRVNPNRTDGQGGYFVPPLWLIDEYVALARAGRVIANSIRNLTLPAGTDSINVPKVATGTATAPQTADAQAVASTDMTDSTISAGVKTIAGQQDIAIQLLDQSPISFDEVIFADLMADYNAKVDVQVIRGTNANGQVKGFTGISGVVAVTYTDGTPTLQELWPSFGKVLSQMSTARFLPPTAWFMHPRRWYWGTSTLDTAGRPLFTPSEAAPFNPLALQTGVVAEGPVGTLLGLPVLLDPNITTVATGGAQTGGTEDEIYALRTPDHYLWEGTMRSRTLAEVLSGTLQIRLQVYNYIAYLGERYASSTGKISDTGLVAPSGF